MWYDLLHDITPSTAENPPSLRILILLLLSLTWIVSVYRIGALIYDAFCELLSQLGDTHSRNPYDEDGRQLIRLQRAYNRLVDHYEIAKFENLSQFVDTNGFMLCYLFSLASGLVGEPFVFLLRQCPMTTTRTNRLRMSPNGLVLTLCVYLCLSFRLRIGWILLVQRVFDYIVVPVLESIAYGHGSFTFYIKHCYVFLTTDTKFWVILLMTIGASALWLWLFHMQWTVAYDNPNDVLGISRDIVADTPTALEQIQDAYRSKASQLRSHWD